MEKFAFYSPEDYDNGLYINSRRNNLQTTSPYTIAQLSIDASLQPSVTTYFGNAPLAQPNTFSFVGGRDYETTTPYASYTIPNTTTLSAYAVDVVFDTSLAGVFAKTYVDKQNLPNINTYNPQAGATVIEHIPLSGIVGQSVSLYHSGYADKNGQTILGPINFSGLTISPSTTISPNSLTPILSDNWTITANANNFSLTRASTATTKTYGYNTQLVNAIPGYNLFVNSNQVHTNDKASIATYPGKLDLLYYTLYTALAPNGQWVSPVIDSGDPNNNWEFAKYQTAYKSTSTYLSNFAAGNTPQPDSSWMNVIPPTISVNDFTATNQVNSYRQQVASLNQTPGRYSQATFTINAYTDYLQNVELYAWNPVTDPIMRLQGPVVQGSNMQQLMAAYAMAMTDWQDKYTRFTNSFAISTAEREYLFAKGQLLRTPIRLNESQAAYRNRLELVAQGLTQAGTIAYMQLAIQAYTGSTSAFVKELARPNVQWIIGTSDLTVNTYLGQANINIWQYEVHVPGAGNYDPDGLVAFVRFLNPIGAVPFFIFE